MTLCIAIACDCYRPSVSPKFIVIADRLITTIDSSTQVALKVKRICPGWYGTFSGSDIAMVDEVFRVAVHAIGTEQNPDGTDIAEAFENAYQSIRRKLVTATYLSQYGWSIDDFLQKGRESFGETFFAMRRDEIEGHDLGFKLLLSGFNSLQAEVPLCLEVINPGVVQPSPPSSGYALIGSGEAAAKAYLDWRRQVWATPLEESLYNGIAAKSFAEGAGALGVGSKTTALIVERGKEPLPALTADQVKAITEIWQKEEANVRPDNITGKIRDIIVYV